MLKKMLTPAAFCASLLIAGADVAAADNKCCATLAISQPCQQGKISGKYDRDAAEHSCWMSPDCNLCASPPV